MRDEEKTNEQLIEELQALRQRHADLSLEAAESKKAEEESRRQKEVLQIIFDHIPVMISFIDSSGRMQMVNRHWEQVLGWSLAEAKDLDLLAKCYPDPQYRQQVLENIRRPPPDWSDFRPRIRDGRILDTCWANVLLSDGTSIGFGLDVTARKQAERDLETSAARLHALTRRLVEVQEQERRRLAGELHDGICQDLTSLALAFEVAASAAPGAAEAKMSVARNLLDKVLTQVRELSFDLRPGVLDHFGLLPGLRALIERYSSATEIEVDFIHSGLERRFAPELETAAYRIVQEGLNNVARHAGTSETAVRVWVDSETLTVQVEDTGVGFDADAVLDVGCSNSLTTMRERAMLLGGCLVVDSTPGGGTHLLATLPLTGHTGGKIDEHFHRLGR